jgi:alpha-galactosidase
MIARILLGVMAVLWFGSPRFVGAESPTPGEMDEARRWASAKLEGSPGVKTPEVGLVVLANNDPVQSNGRNGRLLRIGVKQYTRGLFCHAASKVVVRLPGPGKSFSAIAGIDSNDQTRPGRGSVVFAVSVGGKPAFQSGLIREGTPGAPVQVDLGGAAEFVLDVGDGGDGIGCDQADWAEARAVLADGRTVWLADLPILGAQRRAYGAEAFFSFTYGGKPSAELLKTWQFQRTARQLDPHRTERTLSWTDPRTGLVLRCTAIEYRDYPTVEWTLYFRNAGTKETPILADVQALDVSLERFPWPNEEWAEFRLHHQTGSPCAANDYEPFETVLKPGTEKRITAAGGRPTNSDLPYFNLEMPTSEGVILVVGWPGQWAAQFARDKAHGLRVRAGQELTRWKLLPGEEVRTPLVVLQFWKGDRIHAQNVWRRWMLAHNLPRPGGRLAPVELAACSSHQFGEMIHANTENQKFFIDRYLEEGLKLDYWWMDAGWYWNKHGWPHTGTWEVDTKRFPGGLRPISDHAHAKGVKTIVWFEPERVAGDTWLSNNRPEWILGGKNGGLLNLGNPEAREWLTGHVDKLLTEQGIDLYRQDFNMDPLGAWRAGDAPDRQGITEIKHVEGYLAYWDELRRRHPEMLIDSCASGGRRNDLETLRRAVPLLRSDYIIEPVGNQCHTYGIAFWMPYFGTGSGAVDAYMLRSVLCPHFTACFDMRRKDLDYGLVRHVLGQWRRFAPYYFGDYYPLTPYSLRKDAWIGWQFDCPERGEGMVQMFRRADSVYEMVRARLRGLDPEAVYALTDLDAPGTTQMTGRRLWEDGLPIAIKDQPGSVVITYKKSRQ